MNDGRLIQEMADSGKIFYSVYKSPVGPLYLIGGNDRIKSILFKNRDSDRYHVEKKFMKSATPSIRNAVLLLDEYFRYITGATLKGKRNFTLRTSSRGDLLIFSSGGISVSADISVFSDNEKKVYRQLARIPVGDTISYKKLSEISGIPDGSRFVGNAMAKNFFPIIIPCHRVIKSDGTRGNYSGGNWIKDYLLDHEKADLHG